MDAEELEAVVKRFGERLREMRTESGMTQAELARKMGVPQNVISRYENGGVIPRWDTVIEFADVFGVGVSAFTIRSDSKKKSE